MTASGHRGQQRPLGGRPLPGQRPQKCGLWARLLQAQLRGPPMQLLTKSFRSFTERPLLFSFLLVRFSPHPHPPRFFLSGTCRFHLLLKLVGGKEVLVKTSLSQRSRGTRGARASRARPPQRDAGPGPGEALGEEQGPQGPPKARRSWAGSHSLSWWNQGLGTPDRGSPSSRAPAGC